MINSCQIVRLLWNGKFFVQNLTKTIVVNNIVVRWEQNVLTCFGNDSAITNIVTKRWRICLTLPYCHRSKGDHSFVTRSFLFNKHSPSGHRVLPLSNGNLNFYRLRQNQRYSKYISLIIPSCHNIVGFIDCMLSTYFMVRLVP